MGQTTISQVVCSPAAIQGSQPYEELASQGRPTLPNSSPGTELDSSHEEGCICGLAAIRTGSRQLPNALIRHLLLQDHSIYQVPNLEVFNQKLYSEGPLNVIHPFSVLEGLSHSSSLGCSFGNCSEQTRSNLNKGMTPHPAISPEQSFLSISHKGIQCNIKEGFGISGDLYRQTSPRPG